MTMGLREVPSAYLVKKAALDGCEAWKFNSLGCALTGWTAMGAGIAANDTAGATHGNLRL